MPIAIGDITQAASASADFVLGVKSGQARLFPINTLGNAIQYTPAGTGTVAMTVKARLDGMPRSIIEFGGDPTGVAACDTAFANAKSSGVRVLYFPAGIYRFNSTILIDRTMELIGEGREITVLRSYVSGDNHGMRIIGETALARLNLIKIKGMKLEYMGAGQTAASGSNNCWSGVYIQRKVIFEDFYVRNFTNDGMYFAPSDASEGATSVLGSIDQAVFFSEMRNTWSKDNGRDGIRVRAGANANLFINCQFDRNGGVGFHHMTDGFATYGNVVIIGQCSYNSSYGCYFENGTDVFCCGLYAEKNGRINPNGVDDNTNNYQNTDYDFFIGDNVSRSHILLGTVFGASYTHVRAPTRGLNEGCGVFHGGLRIYGSTAYRMTTRSSTAVANLAGGATLTDVINKVNELLTQLRAGNAIP